MSTEHVEFALVASSLQGVVSEEDFLRPLGMQPGRSQGFQCWAADGRRKKSSGIAFFRLEVSQYLQHERYVFFEADLQTRLTAIATWLSRQSQETFARISEKGIELVLVINAVIDQNQFELSLPAVLLAELGRLHIRILLTTEPADLSR